MTSPIYGKPLPAATLQPQSASASYLYPSSLHHPSSHSPQPSQASTPFTSSSVQSPPLGYHHPHHPHQSMQYPSFSAYADPASAQHPNSYASYPYEFAPPSAAAAAAAASRNALQLHATSSYDPSAYLPKSAVGHRPQVPSITISGRALPPGTSTQQQHPASAPPTSTSHQPSLPSLNTLGLGSAPSGSVSAGPSMSNNSPLGHSANPVGELGTAVRKRPKYTRSKAGCLVCRQKKVKCDEKKPTCTRCLHGHRECTWPKEVPSTSSSSNQRKQSKSIRGVERDGPNGTDEGSPRDDEDDDVQYANMPLSASTASGPLSAPAFGIPGANYSYPYQQQPLEDQRRRQQARSDGSVSHSRNPSAGSSYAGPGGSSGGSPHLSSGPETGPEPLAPYFRTAHERNLVGVAHAHDSPIDPSLYTSSYPAASIVGGAAVAQASRIARETNNKQSALGTTTTAMEMGKVMGGGSGGSGGYDGMMASYGGAYGGLPSSSFSSLPFQPSSQFTPLDFEFELVPPPHISSASAALSSSAMAMAAATAVGGGSDYSTFFPYYPIPTSSVPSPYHALSISPPSASSSFHSHAHGIGAVGGGPGASGSGGSVLGLSVSPAMRSEGLSSTHSSPPFGTLAIEGVHANSLGFAQAGLAFPAGDGSEQWLFPGQPIPY